MSDLWPADQHLAVCQSLGQVHGLVHQPGRRWNLVIGFLSDGTRHVHGLNGNEKAKRGNTMILYQNAIMEEKETFEEERTKQSGNILPTNTLITVGFNLKLCSLNLFVYCSFQ